MIQALGKTQIRFEERLCEVHEAPACLINLPFSGCRLRLSFLSKRDVVRKSGCSTVATVNGEICDQKEPERQRLETYMEIV